MTTQSVDKRGLDRFDPFTKRARKALFLAEEEAQRFGHASVEPTHLLLALLRDGDSSAARILAALRVDPHRVRMEAERQMKPTGHIIRDFIGLSPQVGTVIRFADEEAHALGHTHIGTEHLLLGMIRVAERNGEKGLGNLSLKPDAVRAEARQTSSSTPSIEASPAPVVSRSGMTAVTCVLSEYTLDSVDLFVEAGACSSRDDAVAMLINAGLEAQRARIAHLTETAVELRRWLGVLRAPSAEQDSGSESRHDA